MQLIKVYRFNNCQANYKQIKKYLKYIKQTFI